VAQLYITHQSAGLKPIRALKGFQRVFLKAGESKKLLFTLTPEQLSLVNETGGLYQPSGKISISVGGGQPGVSNKTSSNIVTKDITVQ
jgi:beta-glucosidase